MRSLARLLKAPAQNAAVAALYSACVAQARAPEFYQILAVPDTIDGRFDLLVLHVVLAMRRLGGEDEMKQQLFDLMFADMDQSLREMGVGDMGIGKRIKPMIAAFYGRMQSYENALAEDDEVLAQALARNLYGKAVPSPEALRGMVEYVRRTVAGLEGQPVDDLLEGRVEFSEPIL
jgi:cytochrome b pre-mRNA-processing protein 3